ncbi:MAG: spermidine/putrescine ABC transporter substrate-binding protein [Oscillospiraceae bacterium]|jgi:spermidine/putrescine transport system substrate-binding protein|nr:spermidine/putrescine ABC transporter substrate-binding protein [Oscillospiraceae bacterium]
MNFGFKKNKIIFFILFFLILGFAAFILFKYIMLSKQNKEASLILNVYNWGNHISDGTNGYLNVNEEFEKNTGIKINYTTYPDNESLYAKLAASGTKYDVIIPSDYMIDKLKKENMLQKLDFSLIPNSSYIDEEFKNLEHDPQNEYSLPYTWGIIGIYYNKSIVSELEKEIDWNILWNKKYEKNILMFEGNPRDSFLIALLKLGFSINTTNKNELEMAANEIIKQKPLIKGYVSDQVFERVSSGETALAPYYADAWIINNKDKNLGFTIPKNTNKFLNSICVPANAEHPKEAMMYINFLCDPEIASQNISGIGYSTPENAAREKIESKFYHSKILYPDEDIIKNAQVLKNLPQDTNDLINDLWLKTRASKSNDTTKLVLIFLIFSCVYIGLKFYKSLKNKRKLNKGNLVIV